MAGLVLHWWEFAPYGPHVEFLVAACDMGEVRRLCQEADCYFGVPDRRDARVSRSDPLRDVTLKHLGELLWRLEDETQWRIGAAAADAWRTSDIARVHDTIEAARQRRRRRK